MKNVLIGQLEDGTSCALVPAHDIDELEARMSAEAGRELYPGELFGAVASQLGVQRVYPVRVPQDTRLEAILSWTTPGRVESLIDLPAETEEDLQIAGL